MVNGRKVHKQPRITEASVESEIRTMLELNGWRVHKTDVMRGVTVDYGPKGKRRFSEGAAGQPDLLAVRCIWAAKALGLSNMAECLYVECKAPGKSPEPHQRAFHEVLRKEGFRVIVAQSWRQLVVDAELMGMKVELR